MLTIRARRLLDFSTEELWDTLTGTFDLVFEDGQTVRTNWKEVVYSSYCWEFLRKFPTVPFLSTHLVSHVLAGKPITTMTHAKLLSYIVWDCYDDQIKGYAVDQPDHELRDQLAFMVYEVFNKMYNDFSTKIEEYVTSLDILDFLEVMENEEIAEANRTVMPDEVSIEATYSVINSVLKDPVKMIHNPIARAVQSGLVNDKQVSQCIGPRGYLTEVDSEIFPHPILSGFVAGIRNLHDNMIESRSAAKSATFSKEPLQAAEYFSRRLQIVSQVVRNLHRGDCGSTKYLSWKVRDKRYGSVGEVISSDLKNLKGKYYLTEAGTLAVIKGNEKGLLGRTIKLRNTIHCQHPDPYGVCTTCMGELSLSVRKGANLGQYCVSSLCQKTTQKVLSVKHFDGSSVVAPVMITQDMARFFKSSGDGNSYLLNDKFRGEKIQMIIAGSEAAGMPDVGEVDNVENLNITRVSEIDQVVLRWVDNNNIDDQILLPVSVQKRKASLTYHMLKYIKTQGIHIDDKGNYIVDMTNWDRSKAVLTLPLRHFNMSDHSKEISSMLESRIEHMRMRDTGVSPDAFLVEFYDLVNSKLDVNLAVLEVVLYGVMIRSASNNDYSLPKPHTDAGLGVMKMLMQRRSLSALMAYQGHKNAILDPMSYLGTNVVDHPFDSILMPHEVLTVWNKKT